MFSLRSLALAALVALGVVVVAPAEASAQGTCRCNMGCHANPGQCVQNSSNNCAAGYAPFCANRASTCPDVGWISCSGDCACVMIPGWDAGMTPGDGSVSMDVSMPPDAPVSMDVTRPPDGPVSMDSPVPPTDSPVPPTDSPVPPGDSPTPPMDSGVSCPDGVVVDGVCYRERCQYQMEIGWVCTTRGLTCRIVGDVPYCVPTCSDAMCAAGTYCDPTMGCQRVPDGGHVDCTTLMCPQGEVCDPVQGCRSGACSDTMPCGSGMVCRGGMCAPGGTTGDGGLGDGATGDGGHNGGRGGCGCRTVSDTTPRGDGAALLALGLAGLAVAALRRRRRARADARASR